jgi:uncharacterized protein YdhG (YjbR/CyaY superfamily)
MPTKKSGASASGSRRKAAPRPAAKAARSSKSAETFTDDERAAMKERAREMKAGHADGEAEVLAKIAAMSPTDRAMAERVHAIVKASAPELVPRTWYGMPAYAKDGDVICFFQNAQKFKSRYSTLGFSDKARLDRGAMWPVAFALRGLGAAEETAIRELVQKALGR